MRKKIAINISKKTETVFVLRGQSADGYSEIDERMRSRDHSGFMGSDDGINSRGIKG